MSRVSPMVSWNLSAMTRSALGPLAAPFGSRGAEHSQEQIEFPIGGSPRSVPIRILMSQQLLLLAITLSTHSILFACLYQCLGR